MNIVKHGEQSMFIALQGIILHRPHQEQCMIIAPGGHKNIIRDNACYCLRLRHVHIMTTS
jgi:hypothetical protein